VLLIEIRMKHFFNMENVNSANSGDVDIRIDEIPGTVVGRTHFKAQTVSLALLTSSTSFFSWGK
jgi:hypothetical protein